MAVRKALGGKGFGGNLGFEESAEIGGTRELDQIPVVFEENWGNLGIGLEGGKGGN